MPAGGRESHQSKHHRRHQRGQTRKRQDRQVQASFVEAGDEGYLDPRCWNPAGWAWQERKGRAEPGSWSEQLRHPNRPVAKVSWYEADAYCRWTEGDWELRPPRKWNDIQNTSKDIKLLTDYLLEVYRTRVWNWAMDEASGR